MTSLEQIDNFNENEADRYLEFYGLSIRDCIPNGKTRSIKFLGINVERRIDVNNLNTTVQIIF